jgi:serine/threonine-protein kinase
MASETDDSKSTTTSGLRVVSPEPGGGDVPSTAGEIKPPPSTSRYGAGDVIAEKYRLGRKLGEGGMGAVWLAHNETLDIDVAIKLIRGEVASAEMADRLLQEARAAARLGHPAIVRVNDFGKTSRGDPFIVMELLDGQDLAGALAKRGRLSAIKAVRTLLPIAHALTVAHNKGIVHRDLKPENVFLAKNDEGQIQPKLVDFGVAKLETDVSQRLTQNGALVGSPLYMSPEQARGDDVDHRADIWALAVVLYETITGRPPFEGKNYNAVLYSITANPPTPITELDVGDAELWTILERGLQKDPDRRWYSMRDFGEALARWLEDRDVHEDITGASLQTAWLQWNKEEDQLDAGPSSRPPQADGASGLPPLPRLGPPPGEGTRQRVITIRKPRSTRAWYVLGAIAFLALLASGIALFMLQGVRDRSTTGTVAPSRAGDPATATPVPENLAPAPPEDPEHERAVEEALATDNANRQEPGAAQAARLHAQGRAAGKPPGPPVPTPPAPSGMAAKRPAAAARPAATLKNPYE